MNRDLPDDLAKPRPVPVDRAMWAGIIIAGFIGLLTAALFIYSLTTI